MGLNVLTSAMDVTLPALANNQLNQIIMKTNTIYVTLRVDYTFDEMRTSPEDAAVHALDLINPNYNSVVEGVSLDNVELCNM